MKASIPRDWPRLLGGWFARAFLHAAAAAARREGHVGPLRRSKQDFSLTTGETKMTKTILLSMCLGASSLALNARAEDERQYTDGPVTNVSYLHVEYGHFEDYIDWLNSTWKPTMEANKKAGLIVDYKVFMIGVLPPPAVKADQPNMILWITFKNLAALDKTVELEAVAKKVIGSTEVQNKARVIRNEYRTVLGNQELIRELILK